MLKAYIDDSSSTQSAFVLAGYVSTPERWRKFSDDWQAILDMSPALSRLKMAEAHGTWSDEMWRQRLPLFYAAIEDHAMAGISLIIPYADFSKFFRGRKYFQNPYNFAFTEIITQLALRQTELGLVEPIDFIFDEGQDERIALVFDRFKEFGPPTMVRMLGERPKFGNDEKLLPLQAADLLAWWRHRNFKRRVHPEMKSRKAPWVKRKELLYLDLEWKPGRAEQLHKMFFGDEARLRITGSFGSLKFISNL